MEKYNLEKIKACEIEKYCLEQIELIDSLLEDSDDVLSIDEETKGMLTGNRDAFDEIVMLINGEQFD